ncbi:MAG TPA: HEAT repeat domain-containing protein [Opitutaceae bacterium]
MARTRTALAARLVLSAGVLVVSRAAFCAEQSSAEQRATLPHEALSEGLDVAVSHAFDSAFFRESSTGQTILAFLLCVDFDCHDALQAIERLGPDAVPPLLQLLHDGALPEPANATATVSLVRVATALGRLRDPRAVKPMLEALPNPDPVVRANVAAALGQLGSEAALPYLTPLLQDEDPLMRELTAGALQALGSRDALPFLRRSLRTETLPHVHQAIRIAIRHLER